jgi:hypothetical protein
MDMPLIAHVTDDATSGAGVAESEAQHQRNRSGESAQLWAVHLLCL